MEFKFNHIVMLFAAVFIMCSTSCKTPTVISGENAYAEFTTQCLGVNASGVQTLRTFGTGINKGKAIEDAKRNAVETVIFKGVVDGPGNCNKRPIVNTPNAREKYEDYFNAFFREGGAYNKYVSLEEKRTSRIKASSNSMESWGVVVNVDRTALRERLINDNVIER